VRAALAEVDAHARASSPQECCGLLLGTANEIVDALPAANLADDPSRNFLIDPKAHLDGQRAARARGLAIVGFYHSHPRSAPVPSAQDLAGATYPDHWYLIVRPLAADCDARLFRLEGEQFVRMEIEIG